MHVIKNRDGEYLVKIGHFGAQAGFAQVWSPDMSADVMTFNNQEEANKAIVELFTAWDLRESDIRSELLP